MHTSLVANLDPAPQRLLGSLTELACGFASDASMNHLDDDAQTRHDGSCGNPNHSASGLDSVFGPRRPMFRSAIGGIPRHGTGIGGVQRSALVSIGRGTGVGGESRIAWRSIGRGTG